MDAAISLHGALPVAAAAAAAAASSHHRALHLKPTSSSAASSANNQHQQQRLSVVAARPSGRSRGLERAAAAAAPATPVVQKQQQRKQHHSSSSRAATGYAAALADASLHAGTLPRAARHARALLFSGVDVVAEDSRVVALVRMLVAKGKGSMVADVMAEFAAICDRILLPAATSFSY